jgi:hypothetical protein
MNKVVIEDFYHMTTMDENMNWMKLTHSLSKKLSKPYGPLLYIYLYFKILNRLSKYIYNRKEKMTSPLCILCMLMPQIITLSTITLVHKL